MRAPAVAALLVLLTVAPLAASQVPGTTQNARSLSVLEYHPFPDPERADGEGGDPFGVPVGDTGADRMRNYYGAFWFPTTRFDGVLESSYARDGNVGNMRQFYELYLENVEDRLTEDAPLVAVVDGTLRGDAADVAVRFTAKDDLGTLRPVLRVVLFEDDVVYEGGNGVDVHRFVVRAVAEDTTFQEVARGGRMQVNHTFAVDPAWDADRLGVVAFVQNEDETSSRWAATEVLQSATYFFTQNGPTVQATRSVLIEMYTATWCPSCVYGDGAVDLLAEEFGAPSSLKAQTSWTYLRTPGPLQAAIGVAAAGALAFLVIPRKGREGAP